MTNRFALSFLASLGLLTVLCVYTAELLVFRHLAEWPQWALLWVVPFFSFLAFLALLPAAAAQQTAKASVLAVQLVVLLAPLVEVIEVISRRLPRVVNPIGSGITEYWYRVAYQLLFPALFALLAGLLWRWLLTRRNG